MIKLKNIIENNPFLSLAVIGLGAFGIFRLVKKSLPSNPDKVILSEAKDEVKVLEKQGQVLSRSKSQWALVAESIYNSIKYSGVSDNKVNAENQLKMVKNDLDLLTLIEVYGLRQLYYFGFPDGDKMTLIAAIATGELDKAAINRINNNYATKGIKFRF